MKPFSTRPDYLIALRSAAQLPVVPVSPTPNVPVQMPPTIILPPTNNKSGLKTLRNIAIGVAVGLIIVAITTYVEDKKEREKTKK